MRRVKGQLEYDPVAWIIHLHASGVLLARDPIGYFEEIDNDPSFQAPAEELRVKQVVGPIEENG